jgi:hypothetical protein
MEQPFGDDPDRGGAMPREQLIARVLDLYPQLAEVEPWQWSETEQGEPVALIEGHDLHRARRGRE